jgi:hypothetical protein
MNKRAYIEKLADPSTLLMYLDDLPYWYRKLFGGAKNPQAQIVPTLPINSTERQRDNIKEAATYQWQGQEMIEAKPIVPYDPNSRSSVQQLQDQWSANKPELPSNIVALLKQYMLSRRNNDDKWNANGDKIK